MIVHFILLVTVSHSFHINCGGKSVTVNGSRYDDDQVQAGPAAFYQSGSNNWAFSSTGDYMDYEKEYYIISKESMMSTTNAELYMNARVSPTSLTYYGFCLRNGNYTVNLYFAEIMFTDDQTYNSLGRRVFDIYIQVHDKHFFLLCHVGVSYGKKDYCLFVTRFLRFVLHTKPKISHSNHEI